MLMSMTGHGQAQHQADDWTIVADVRTVNARFFKLALRIPEGYVALEPRIDAFIRQHIRRGTVYVSLSIDRQVSPSDYRLNTVALESYRRQLAAWLGEDEQRVAWQPLLALPGIVEGLVEHARDDEPIWREVEKVLTVVCQQVNAVRRQEGQAMADDLKNNCQAIRLQLQAIQERAPLVVDAYRTKLLERINKYLAEFDVAVSASDVVREVGLFAERADISEEMVRLRSHLDRFESLLADGDESPGRKLEFVVQEMFREANTMGAKANDAEIAHRVVEIKTYIERMREMIQNIE